MAQALQEDLKAIGIEMTITTQDWSYVNQDVREGNYDMAFLNLGWSEPMLLVDNFCNRSDIAAECSNLEREGYLELVAKARATVDYDERTQVISEIQYKLFDYATILPLIRGTDLLVITQTDSNATTRKNANEHAKKRLVKRIFVQFKAIYKAEMQ